MIRDINWAISAWKANVSTSSSSIGWSWVWVSSGICKAREAGYVPPPRPVLPEARARRAPSRGPPTKDDLISSCDNEGRAHVAATGRHRPGETPARSRPPVPRSRGRVARGPRGPGRTLPFPRAGVGAAPGPKPPPPRAWPRRPVGSGPPGGPATRSPPSAPAAPGPRRPPQTPPNRPLTLAKGPHRLRDDAAPGRRSNWRAAPALPLYRRGPARRAAPFPEASRTFRKNPPQPPPRPRACACALAAAPPLSRARAGPPRVPHPQRPPRASPRRSQCAGAARNSREGLASSGAAAPRAAHAGAPAPTLGLYR